LSAIACADNFSFEKPNSRAVIFIGKMYGIKPVSRVDSLLCPVVATVCCPQDDAFLAHERSNVGINEVHTEKVQAGKWIAYAAVLSYPGVTTVCRS
jgi:hypothetical protein